jgi:hypothetical protein
VPLWAYPALTLASLLLGATYLVRGTSAVNGPGDSDLLSFFLPSADYILKGDPWHMYAVRFLQTYPNYNPPLSMFLLAPLLGLARAFGATNYGAEITFVALPFVVLIPLLGYTILLALRALYPEIPETQRLLAFVLVVLSPLAWQSIATWYHQEQPLMLILLVVAVLALQRRQTMLAGVLAGLAVLTRTTAVVPLIALGVLLVAARDWRALSRFGGVAAGVAAIGLAPFFLFDPKDTIYSLVSWRGTAIIGSNSIWTLFAYNTNDGSLRHLLDAIARRLDFYAVALFVVAVAWLAARRLGVTAYTREAWAVLGIATLAVPLLSKTVWPYYYLEPFVFLLIWEFASMHDRRAGVWRWPVLTVGFLAVTATLSQYIGLHSVGAGDRIAVGALQCGAMLAFAAAVWVRMQATKPGAAPQGMGYGEPVPASQASAPWGPRPAPAIPGALPGAVPGPNLLPPGLANPPSYAPNPGASTPNPPPNVGRSPLWPGEQGQPPQTPNPNGPPRRPWSTS